MGRVVGWSANHLTACNKKADQGHEFADAGLNHGITGVGLLEVQHR